MSGQPRRQRLIAPEAYWPKDEPLTSEAIEGAERHAVLTIQRFIADHMLPREYQTVFRQLVIPMAAWLVREQRQFGRPLRIGVSGSQGSGKTTLVRALEVILQQCFSVPACVLSLDDFYLSRADRKALSKALHPLLMTRGVPGTHDVELLARTLGRLQTADERDLTRLPVFDKSRDDQLPEHEQRVVQGRPQIIFMEGWCLGAQPESASALATPVNQLEATEDPDGRWRRYVNSQLAGPYHELFERMDRTLALEAPSWEAVCRWRQLQEEKLIRQQGDTYCGGLDTGETFQRFMAHYERITRHQLETPQEGTDIRLQLNDDQGFERLTLAKVTEAIAE